MERTNRHIILLLSVALLVLLTMGCSTQKNTAKSRWWHSFNARYNTYYNASLAYIDGSLEKENGNQDNFTEIIPLYTVGNKKTRETGKGNFERAIEKCQKAIKLHSIKKKPEWNKSRRKTEKDIEWLSRREYNPFLWKAWLLMGRSQFYEGAFDDAASTFAYMSRIYQSQPAIYGRARAWLAKSYIEQEWLYDAEDVIRNMKRDSIHKAAQKEWDYTLADYYIHLGDYEQAIPYLRKVIKHEMRKKQKAREYFLLGQLEAKLGHRDLAYKAYKKVVRLNPPYEVEFNAQIAMTEVLAEGQSKKMIARLKRMAASDNNKDYLDQVYYAIGNIWLAQKDTAQAISAYEKGNKKATRSGIEKGVLLLKLGDLYWAKEKFSDAGRCYGEAIGLLDKEREDYEQLSNRSKILDELTPYTEAVHLQDSLQALAKMSEKDRNAAIDRVIEALKKKEKEEKRLQAEANAQQTQQKNAGTGNRNAQNTTTNTNQTTAGKWYFYNPLAVQQGKQTFEKLWGKRENVDNWQRVNKTVVAGAAGELTELTDEMRDSIARQQAVEDSLEQIKDSAQNDPHKREYYLAQIPFTEEQLQASNLILEDGLYNSGVIFKDKLDNLRLSEKNLRRLTDNYPDFEHMDDVYYHLFLLYSRMGMPVVADQYVQKLKSDFPESQWTGILSDPYFKENAQFGAHIEDSIYGATYEAFKADRYGEVRSNTQISETRFPLGANRDKFIFINGLGKLNNDDGDGCLEDMNTIVTKYPQSPVASLAGMIVNGVKEGRRLRGGKFDMGDVWARRSVVLNDSDSINARQFSNERNTNFVFIVAYQPDSVNENQLLYELARYNFTSYMVRNFDISIEEAEGLHHIKVTGFLNFDEALQYARQLHQQENIVRRLGKSRSIVISEQNLELLGKQFSYDDYDKFYSKHFAPLKISTFQLLSEPAEIGYEREKDNEEVLTPEEIDRALDAFDETPEQEGTVIPLDEEPQNNLPEEGTTIPLDVEPQNEQPVEGTVVPLDEAPQSNQPAGGTVVPMDEEPQNEEPAGGTVIPMDEEPIPATQEMGTTVVPLDEPPVRQNVQQQTVVKEEKTTRQQTKNVAPTSKTTIQKVDSVALKAAKLRADSIAKAATVVKKDSVTNAQKPKAQIVKPTPRNQNEDGIYFNDDLPVATPQSKNKQNNQNNKKKEPVQSDDFDLEDEYYDLEGF